MKAFVAYVLLIPQARRIKWVEIYVQHSELFSGQLKCACKISYKIPSLDCTKLRLYSVFCMCVTTQWRRLDCEKFEIRYRQGFTVSYHAITIYSIDYINLQKTFSFLVNRNIYSLQKTSRIKFNRRTLASQKTAQNVGRICHLMRLGYQQYMSQMPLYFTFKYLKNLYLCLPWFKIFKAV